MSAAPITGGHGKAEVTFGFDMKVSRMRETPRVTKPYSDETWAAIDTSGRTVDERLVRGDVRLSMGGEPTFVAADDMEGAEWNIAAVGPTKRGFADDLVRRLQKRFAPGGLLHYGQGKWYPGEQLPRWAFALHWRTDNKPLWEEPELIAPENPDKAKVKPATIAEADSFVKVLCRRLQLPPDAAIPAFEDAAHFALVEQKLPVNVTTADNKLDDPATRQRIVRIFDQGLDKPSSYVLPIQAWNTIDHGRRWTTERWTLRREKLFLLPGDSPAGFRLPLGSFPVLPKAEFPHVAPSDPFAPCAPLPERQVLLQTRPAAVAKGGSATLPDAEIAAAAVRTALTVEPREGRLWRIHAATRKCRGLCSASGQRRGDRARNRPAGSR